MSFGNKMTQRDEKKVRDETSANDRATDDSVGKPSNEEFAGVHILGEKDSEKHFGPAGRASDTDKAAEEQGSVNGTRA